MTASDRTHLSLVLDRSGSMRHVQVAAQAAVNDLLQEQFACEGRLTVTVTEFDHEVRTVRRMADQPFAYRLRPRGMTALFDAIGHEVERTGRDLAAMEPSERPGLVSLVIVTDGNENASRSHSVDQVKGMLAHQRSQFGWDVRFLGADEASLQGQALGLPSVTFTGDAAGTRSALMGLSASLTSFRRRM